MLKVVRAQFEGPGERHQDRPGACLFKSPAERQLHSHRFRAQVSSATTAPAGRTIKDLRHYAASN